MTNLRFPSKIIDASATTSVAEGRCVGSRASIRMIREKRAELIPGRDSGHAPFLGWSRMKYRSDFVLKAGYVIS